MNQLHPALLASQGLLPRETPVHLLTRHSIREQPENQFADGSVPLTDEGRELAFAWGEQIERPFGALYTSPIGRCVETAEYMIAGSTAAKTSLVARVPQKTTVLVEPGCFVADINLAGPHFFRLGAKGFINTYLSDRVPGVLTPAAGLSKLATYLHHHQGESGTVAVHVTHDTILAAFVSVLLGKQKIDTADWPWMLEGLWCWFSSEGLHWVWRGEQGVTPLEFHQDGSHLVASSSLLLNGSEV